MLVIIRQGLIARKIQTASTIDMLSPRKIAKSKAASLNWVLISNSFIILNELTTRAVISWISNKISNNPAHNKKKKCKKQALVTYTTR